MCDVVERCVWVRCQRSLILSEMWRVTILSVICTGVNCHFSLLLTVLWLCLWSKSAPKSFLGKFMIGWKRIFLNCKNNYISIGRRIGACLRSDLFSSFCYNPSFKHHLFNVIFFLTEVYARCFFREEKCDVTSSVYSKENKGEERRCRKAFKKV